MISACNSTPYETAAKVQKKIQITSFLRFIFYKIHDWNISLMVIVFLSFVTYTAVPACPLSFAYPCVAQSND
jgi:hypothetical protein